MHGYLLPFMSNEIDLEDTLEKKINPTGRVCQSKAGAGTGGGLNFYSKHFFFSIPTWHISFDCFKIDAMML